MIDNQADYDKIFRGGARVPRSPSHQGSAPAPVPPLPPVPSSSAGFPVQTPLPAEVRPTKPKSPPPQVCPFHSIKNLNYDFVSKVDKLMPSIQMPNTSEEVICRPLPRNAHQYFISSSLEPMNRSLLLSPKAVKQFKILK